MLPLGIWVEMCRIVFSNKSTSQLQLMVAVRRKRKDSMVDGKWLICEGNEDELKIKPFISVEENDFYIVLRPFKKFKIKTCLSSSNVRPPFYLAF